VSMDLTEQQVSAIREWAQRAAPYVEKVRLYGSRAKGALDRIATLISPSPR
jgi:hypothetical protein